MIDILILGAGASGLMSAVFLKNKNIALVDGNYEIGKKISISGGGRCNFTNEFVTEDNYLGDREFLNNVFREFNNKDVIKFFKNRGLKYEKIKNNQYFCKNSAKDILNIFTKELKNVKKYLGYKILDVEKKDDIFIVYTDKKTFKAKNLIVATGGISFKSIGATDIGYKIAQKFNHTIKPLNPALVGFTVQKKEFWFKNLSGVSVFAEVEVGEKIFKDNILFTHKGISGPAILNSSLYWKKGQIKINFLPNFKFFNSNKHLTTILPLPKRFIKEFLQAYNIENKPLKDSKDVINLLQNYYFSPAGTFGFSKAEVTRGGIDINEIDLKFESKKVKNLFFIGEVLDITGELGGYNFQFAFSSGYICSKNFI